MQTTVPFRNSLRREYLLLALLCALCGTVSTARANVFATEVRLNNTTTNLLNTAGDNVTISYRLNENATTGLTVSVLVHTNTVWSTNFPGGSSETFKGLRSVTWNGLDNFGSPVTNGLWSVRVTPAATGYADWTQINSPAETLYQIYWPRGIAVNPNTNSLYFGQLYVANSELDGTNQVGIHLLRPDGSSLTNGFSTGGWPWTGNGDSPWKIEVDAADRVCIMQGGLDRGTLIGFNPLVQSGSGQTIMQSNNWPSPSVNFTGHFLTGTGSTGRLYMADSAVGGAGIRRWNLGTNGLVTTNNTGVTVVTAGGASDLELAPYDMAVDPQGRIFTIQYIESVGTGAKVLRFPAYTNTPLAVADWKVTEAGPYLAFAQSLALSSRSNWLAVACRPNPGTGESGTLTVLSQADGALVKVVADGTEAENAYHDFTDVAWDPAGNLCAADLFGSRIFSPPGSNSFDTVSVQGIKIGPYLRPSLSAPQLQGSQFALQLFGELGVYYAIETSTNLTAWSAVATNRAIGTTTAVTVPAGSGRQVFFRARAVN